MTQDDLHQAIAVLKRDVRQWRVPVVGMIANETRDPFRILVSCLLSLRTKDATTASASSRLFARATTPEGLAALPVSTIERSIYPVGFYRTKARSLKALCRDLLRRYRGRVPDDLDELLTLHGVGRKTANLVMTLGFGKPGICVDTHVHRISNRWGYVRTKAPDATEQALRRKLPRPYWIVLNDLLVPYGQHRCTPVSPFCSECGLHSWCRRVGVTRSR
jgi:endonuclease-3